MSTPLPANFWLWARWRLGHGEFKPYGPRYMPKRPKVPWAIPARWWTAYLRMWPPQPKLPPPVQVPPPYTFFQRQCVWANHPDGAHPAVLAPLMGEGGQTLAIVQVLDGLTWPSAPETSAEQWEAMTRARVAGLQNHGIAVAGWGWGKAEDIIAEAELAWERCQSLGLSGYVMNGEKPYEFGGKSGTFVSRFRELAGPTFPLGWSPEPQLALDHGVLQGAGVCYMPQAYPGENRWDVEGCVNVGLRFGYKLPQIIPLVSVYDGTPASAHVVSAHRVGARWLCLYPTNSVLGRPNVFKELGSI